MGIRRCTCKDKEAMNSCNKFGKTIHIPKYRCENCKQTFCFDYMVKVEVSPHLGSFFNLIDELHAPEYSWLNFGSVYCSDCDSKFHVCKEKLGIVEYLKV